jgi:hypothetical protein
VGGCQGDVDIPRFLDRLTAVHSLEHGQLASALLDEPGEPEDVAGAPAGSQPGPGARGVRRRFHRPVDVDLVGLRHLGQHFLSGRVHGREAPPGMGSYEPAADEEVVGIRDPHVVDGLGRRRVLEPSGGDELGGWALGDGHLPHQSFVK